MNYPLKLNVKTEALPAGFVAIAAVLSVYFYAHFPGRVASHWGFTGQVDGWSSRASGAFAIPVMMLFMYLMFLALPLLDPKKERYAEFEKVYHVFKTVLIGLFFVLYIATGLYNLGLPVRIGVITPVLVGGLFIVLGNYMGKIKKNWFMGIRTPWTLSSENVWNKTHRVGGWTFIIFGFCMMAAPFLPETVAIIVLVGGVAAVSVGTMAYSYFLYSKEQSAKRGPAGR